ncbi:branched-chain amino acid transport system II carrier protein [Fructilactobacillus carniphilus]|uniref:Branched-chain amino acid transport system carrier protein n=1 Tax=Fructilactobacillus carniphilus TaxID=2940297 RepID=A0ABY5BXR9_9LACO|nr:branched-chain amino acid transport system II carrier protein [Fructilactobacillus carniphilus]USS91314.1 branched-chain amino acid transport system II carrier protein [Fructilactobacillus carniphilus]
MNELETPQRLKGKQLMVLASLLFALFFGAGNLIFPVHLGQTAGVNWVPAAIGFLLSAILLPLFSIFALGITKSKNMFELLLPVGSTFSLLFLLAAHGSMGLLIGSPRLATVTFTMGVQPFLPSSWQHPALLVFSGLFFLVIVLLAYRQTSITNSVGKVLNPLFILLILFLFVVAFLVRGDVTHLPLAPAAGQGTTSLVTGFLEGYNTMDALAGLGFGVTIIAAVRSYTKSDRHQGRNIVKIGLVAMGLEAVIYVGLIALGVVSLSYTKASADGGTAFTQIMAHYTGVFGAALLATLTLLACLTTAVGVLTSFAQDLGNRFPRIGYHKFLIGANVIAFAIANFGLDQIIAFSAPILSLLYPIAITVIALALLNKWVQQNPVVYRGTVGLVLIPASLDCLHTLPPVLHQLAPVTAIDNWCSAVIPWFKLGLYFIPFLLVGLVGSSLVACWQQQKLKKSLTN